MPAGSCQDNNFQHLLGDARLYHLSQDNSDLPMDDSLEKDLLVDDCHQSINPSVETVETYSNSPSENDSNNKVLILRCIDKASSSLPSWLTLNEDHIRTCIGFHCIDTIKRHLSTLYQNTIHLDSTPEDAVLDKGHLATLRKTLRNTTTVSRPLSFGEVIHMDIIFGPEVALANVHYGLLFTDRYSHSRN